MSNGIYLGRQKLSASARGRRPDDDEDVDVELQTRRDPAKLTVSESAAQPGNRERSSTVGKTTRVADEPIEASPADGIAYADWVLAPERGWAPGRIDRRAQPGDSEVDDGALATAFSFLESSRAGVSLPDTLRRQLELELGTDLSAVRIHTDDRAAKAAESLRARAFAIGNDIYFASGAYDPTVADGIELIAHECAHVAQTRGGSAAGKRQVSRPEDSHEQHADQFARAFSGGRRRHFDSRDPATIVEHVRREGRRMNLPFMSELEKHFSSPLDFVEVYTGEAAKVACELMAAGAFAVRNIVAFADPTPQRDLLMHELTHIMQMGQRRAPIEFETGSLSVGVAGSAIEREAAEHPEHPLESASPDVIHRGQPPAGGSTSTDDSGTPQDRVKKFVQSRPPKIKDFSAKADRPSTAFGSKGGDGYDLRFWSTEENAWGTGIYKNSDPKNKAPDDLKSIVDGGGTVTGTDFRLHRAGSGKWVFSKASKAPNETYKADIEALDIPGKWSTAYWGDGSRGISKLTKVADKLKWGASTFDAWDPAITDAELGAYRDAMEKYVSEGYQSAAGKWDDFFTEVVKANVFPHPYKRIVGNIFEKLVALCTQSDAEFKVDAKQVVVKKKGKAAVLAMADGKVGKNDGGKVTIIAECKAWTKGPGTAEREQAQRYNKMLGNITAYTETADDGTVTPLDIDHVVYYFSDATVADLWKPMLTSVFGAVSPSGKFSVVPPFSGNKGTDFKVHYNPDFTFTHEPGQTHVHLAPPPMQHPGLVAKELDVTLNESGEVQSGYIIAGLDLDGAVKGEPKKQIITKGDDGGKVENKFSGLQTSLKKVLGERITPDAKLTDDGVEATVTISPGSSGIPGFQLTQGELKIKYSGQGALSVSGTVGLSRKMGGGTISGDLTVAYGNGDWDVAGNVTITDNVVDGLKGFTGGFQYSKGEVTITADKVAVEKKFKAVTLTGTATQVKYEAKTGMFSGKAQLDADMGLFGMATASATIKDNKLAKAELSYDTPELKYPAKSEKPTLKGTIGGTITYENERFSGAIRGNANLAIPALEKFTGEGGAGLAVNAHVNPDGSYGGTIATTSPIKFGDHFKVDSVSCTLKDDGSVSGSFKIDVVGIKHLEHVSVKCTVDKDGVQVDEAEVAASIGTEGTDKFWGSLAVSYKKEEGLKVTGSVSYKIKEGMVAHGTLTYDSKSNKVTVKLGVDRIELLKYGPITKNLFKFEKQIPLVSVYGLGIYLDLGIALDFEFEMGLGMTPAITLDGLSLSDWSFKSISADVQLDGAIIARLKATPKIGLGIFALSPSLLRGGGGIKVPITGEAALKPTAKLHVQYDPSGGVTGDAKLSMPLTFGITGAVVPYANVSVLDGAWEWNKDFGALTSFVIMPPKELFNFKLDLGADQKKQDPQIPDSPGEPSNDGGPSVAPEKAATKQAEGSAAAKDATTGPSGEGGGLPDEPMKLGSMFDGIKGLPGYQMLEKIMKKAGAAWDAIKGFFGRIIKTFKSFFEGIASAMEEIIDGFSNEGLGYLPKLIKKLVGDSVWNIIEPIVTAIGGVGEKLLDLFESEPPKSLSDFFPWALRMMSKVWSLAWSSIGSVVSAIRTMFNRLADAAVKIINGLVQDGSLGVKRHTYYVWNPNPWGKNWYFFAADWYKINVLGFSSSKTSSDSLLINPKDAVAIALFEVLEHIGVAPTGGYYDSDVGDNSRDRWV